MRVKINHFGGRPNPYRMNSPTASIAVRGTEFSIEVVPQGDTQVVVYEGAVEVSSLADPDRKTLIEAGRGVLVQAGQDFHLFDESAGRAGDLGDHDGDQRPARPPRGPGPPMVAGNAGAQSHRRDQPVPTGQPGLRTKTDGHSVPPRRTSNTTTPRRAPPPSTYDRYIAGLSDIAQVPFLFRYNALPEAHLDSLENPAYATGFTTGEGRLFVLPSFSGVRGLQEYQTAFGPGGTLPGDYRISPQFSMFTPLGKQPIHLGGQRLGIARRQHQPFGHAGLRSRDLNRRMVGRRAPAALPPAPFTPARWCWRGVSDRPAWASNWSP